MRIVIATDKFKHSLDAPAVGTHLARGLRAAAHAGGAEAPEIDLVPLADGGEGTLRAALDAGARAVPVRVTGPNGVPVDTAFALLSDTDGRETALIELATASGLDLVPPAERDAGRASSVGTGELIRAALDHGASRVILAVGGSANSDGGAGLLSALGVLQLDAEGSPIPPGGLGLESLASVDLTGVDPRVFTTEFVLASDVDNPLCGPRGAAHVFGEQKGADAELRDRLDAALARWARVLADTSGTGADSIRAAADAPGAGAAGGVGFAALGILRAERRPGIEVVRELTGVDALIRAADLVITGEGSLDAQSLGGKVPVGVAEVAHAHDVPVIAVCGRSLLTAAQARDAHLGAVYPLTSIEPDPARSMAEAGPLLERLAADIWDAYGPARA
ncbi:glycerate kinase [Mycetocola tolaasinivorans]|uniref:Glycerate kinase n=1 Tax=Mycetocola tolaasinivorans TaxID=76635 RepID=A0A3L7AEA5_9MICO|nr:glycerate kinase [Mycetocola tolaasinivorans]RLP78038.1 glycerate kinase [Mycetocola tolaasinivorans]